MRQTAADANAAEFNERRLPAPPPPPALYNAALSLSGVCLPVIEINHVNKCHTKHVLTPEHSRQRSSLA